MTSKNGRNARALRQPPRKRGDAEKITEKKVTAEELEKAVNDPETQKRVTATFQKSIADLRRGLPPATSEDLLYSKMK